MSEFNPNEFQSFRKIPRLSREVVVTEKIDGTNAQLLVTEDGKLYAGSRSRWLLTPESDVIQSDNFGFGAWALTHREELIKGLGVGRHYGEWWGTGIQRNYGLKEKKFSLFNVNVWSDDYVRPSCCSVVPTLYKAIFDTVAIDDVLYNLKKNGSFAAPGFMRPEGIVIYHIAAGLYFKKTIEKDESPKGNHDV